MTLLTEPRRERKVTFGSLQVSVRMPNRTALSIIRSPIYRHLIRPGARSAYLAVRGLRHRAAAPPSPAPAVIPAEPPQPEDLDQQAIAIIQEIADVDWHHTIDFGRGVFSPGVVDHRWQRELYGLPASLDGMRCLDLGTRDGFWAFEMERRGASEVVAVEVMEREGGAPHANGAATLGKSERARGFETARRLLGSKVSREVATVEELTPERFGRFDVVFLGHLFTELRDPQLALERIYSVTSGTVIVASRIDKELEPLRDTSPVTEPALARFASAASGANGWLPSTETLRTMMAVAGFEPVDVVNRFDVCGDEPEMHAVVLHGHVPQRHSWEAFTRPGELVSLPQPGIRRRIWQLGNLELAITMPDDEAKWVTRHPAYRWLVGPAIRMTSVRHKQATQVVSSVAADANGEHKEHAADIAAATADAAAHDIVRAISGIGWYHTINLGHGVITEGFVDHRDQLHHYQLPDSLVGMRCLDVATFDGYFAFEMERRGADEVNALDITTFSEVDMPALLAQEEFIKQRCDRVVGTGFRAAHRILGSGVKRIEGNVYDLTPSVLGKYDFVLLSDLLVHLRDPVLALRRIFSVCSGTFVLAEMFHPGLEGIDGGPVSQYTMRMPYSPEAPMELWWIHSVGSMKAMLEAAGFEAVEEVSRFVLNMRMDCCDKVVLRARVPKAQQGRLAVGDTESVEAAPLGAR